MYRFAYIVGPNSFIIPKIWKDLLTTRKRFIIKPCTFFFCVDMALYSHAELAKMAVLSQ
jgi:hypothetical protein